MGQRIQHGYSDTSKDVPTDKVQIPDSIKNKFDVQRRLDWTESSWENYLEFNLKLVENKKTANDIKSIIDKYYQGILDYYHVLGFDRVPSRVYRDLLIDPCLKSFVEYLENGPKLKLKAEKIATDHTRGMKHWLK